MTFIASAAIRLWCRRTASRRLQLDVEGVDHVPHRGPVLIVSRHYHYLYDGVIYLSILPRRVSILVALDWVPDRRVRPFMEFACHAAGWPTVLREDRLRQRVGSFDTRYGSAYSLGEAHGYLRRAVRRSVALLRGGNLLVVFPEAYPKIDPVASPRNPDLLFSPFRPGFVHLVRNAQRDGATRVSVVPAGLSYEGSDPWRVHVRFGPALTLDEGQSLDCFARSVETAVQELSGSRANQDIHERLTSL